MPSSQSTIRRLAGVACVVLLAAIPASVAASPADALVLADGLRIEPFAPGRGVAVTILTVDGRSVAQASVRDRDASTPVGAPGVIGGPATSAPRVTAGRDACADGRHTELGYHWNKPWAWSFNAGSTPAGIGRRGAEAQLRSAVRSITSARNDCGRPDRVRARARYVGRTLAKPGVRVDANGTTHCASDGRSVVGFGRLPFGVAGMTCTSYGPNGAIESDVLLNKRHHDWALRPTTCVGDQIVLRAVATHEFGHVFGLGHVSEATHPNLTMSESIGPCDDSPFTLGKGDLIGLERLY